MEYSSRIEYLKQHIIIKFSQIGFGIQCKYAICNRIQGTFPSNAIIKREYLETHLQHGDKLYINIHVPNIKECMYILLDFLYSKRFLLKLKFYIMGEPVIPKEIVDALYPYSIEMHLQNNIYTKSHIYNMPIGIRDGEEVFPEHAHYSGRYLLDEMDQPREKEFLCLLCFSYTHPERRICENILGGKPAYILNLNSYSCFNGQPSPHCGKVPVWINYEYTHKSKYTLCPSGFGEATHRFFEAIALHSIPIVKKTHTAFDKLYEEYPCLVVEQWGDVTQELLENRLEELNAKMREFHITHPLFLTV